MDHKRPFANYEKCVLFVPVVVLSYTYSIFTDLRLSPFLLAFLGAVMLVRDGIDNTWLSMLSSAMEIWCPCRPELGEVIAAAEPNFWAGVLRLASKTCGKGPQTLWLIRRWGGYVRTA